MTYRAPGDAFSLGVARFRLTVGRGPGIDTGEGG
jgi:hypothetical protein